jgi:hypothetical protein
LAELRSATDSNVAQSYGCSGNQLASDVRSGNDFVASLPFAGNRNALPLPSALRRKLDEMQANSHAGLTEAWWCIAKIN